MPSPYNVIGASGIKASIGASDDVYKPGVHGAIIVKLERHFMIGDDITNGISNELSVTPTEDGRYLLTFTVLGISDKIGIRVGSSPVGPFGEINEVYTCPEYEEDGLLPYNAKAHYHLSKPGELLISYNTITFEFWEDIQKDATIYHPRFIKVKY